MKNQYVGGSLGSLGKTGTERLQERNMKLRNIDNLLLRHNSNISVDPAVGTGNALFFGHYITIDKYGSIQLAEGD